MIQPFKDAIGDRLDYPERVPAEYQHLIPDDKARVKWILSHPLTGHVLDVGCSDGAITRRLQRTWIFADIHGVDLPWYDIRFPPPNMEPISLYDTIFCCEVLEHLTEADAMVALKNMRVLLKPEGQLILTVPNRNCARHYTAGCRDRWRWPDHRSVWFTAKLREALNVAGFRQPTLAALYPPEMPAQSIWLLGCVNP